MEKRRNRPIWGLFAVLLVIFLIGLLCEIVLKAVNATLTMRVRDPRIIVNQVFYASATRRCRCGRFRRSF